jgi:inner membrane protein involved in colicin E2 resistance
MKALFISVLLLIAFFVFKQLDPLNLTFLNVAIIGTNVVLLYLVFISLKELFSSSKKINY